MNLPDLLTYADIDHLLDIVVHYELPRTHSKHELIKTLLVTMQRPAWWDEQTKSLSTTESRFWQLVLLDSRETFNLDELLGKGRQALAEKEGNPRSLVAKAIKKGVLFPNVAGRNRSLYKVPRDVRKFAIRSIRNRFISEMIVNDEPTMYRDEQTCLTSDLVCFLTYIGEKGVRLTAEGAIYRQDLQQVLGQMTIKEAPISKQRWRFGFGRRYHQYPDRFSLLYDYAYYREYIVENRQTLSLTMSHPGKIASNGREAEKIYKFWLRLYRRPFPELPLIVKWVYLLSQTHWVSIDSLFNYLSQWITPYYYMEREDLFDLLIKMLTHLGVIRSSPTAVQMTESGNECVARSTGWDLNELDAQYMSVNEQIFFTKQKGISERMLNK